MAAPPRLQARAFAEVVRGIINRNARQAAIVCFPAAIANAVADATGVRIRRYPLSPERVKKRLA